MTRASSSGLLMKNHMSASKFNARASIGSVQSMHQQVSKDNRPVNSGEVDLVSKGRARYTRAPPQLNNIQFDSIGPTEGPKDEVSKLKSMITKRMLFNASQVDDDPYQNQFEKFNGPMRRRLQYE